MRFNGIILAQSSFQKLSDMLQSLPFESFSGFDLELWSKTTLRTVSEEGFEVRLSLALYTDLVYPFPTL